MQQGSFQKLGPVGFNTQQQEKAGTLGHVLYYMSGLDAGFQSNSKFNPSSHIQNKVLAYISEPFNTLSRPQKSSDLDLDVHCSKMRLLSWVPDCETNPF